MYQRLLLVIISLVLASCGFQLRGTVEIPPDWLELRMVTPSPNGELAKEVRDGFANNGVNWVDAASANYVLQLADERFEQRNLTIGSNARATEFELTLSTTLQIFDRAGNEILAPDRIAVMRVMTHDPENVSGKVEESRLLRNEMRVDLVQQILRKMRFVALNNGAPAPTPEPS